MVKESTMKFSRVSIFWKDAKEIKENLKVLITSVHIIPFRSSTSLIKVMKSHNRPFCSMLGCCSSKNTVNSLYSGHCRDLELVSSLARVRKSGTLFQSNVCNLFFAGDLAAVRIIWVSAIAGCPQGESWLYMNCVTRLLNNCFLVA